MANEIDTRNNLYRRAVEVYLRQHNEMDFEQFQLTYLPSADGSGTIDISIWDYPNITQPTRAQLIALVPRAKQRLARLEKRDRRREKNKKWENLPPAVYVQQGSFHTATSTWSKVPLQEKGETAQTPVEIASNGFYRVSVSGTAVGGAQNNLRIVSDDVHQQVILDG